MRKLLTFSFLLFLLIGVGYYLANTKTTISSDSITLPSPTLGMKPSPPTNTPVPQAAGLEKVVQDSLKGTTGTYALVIKNYETGQTYTLNDHQKFESASLYKLWVMATVFDQIKQEKFEHTDVLTETIPRLNEIFGIDKENAELTEGSISLTVDSALNQMITISHNYAAMLLSKKVGVSKVQAFLNDHGLTESNTGKTGEAPTTTASDIAKFLDYLYNGKLASMADTKAMIDLLKAQKLNSKIPAKLPKSVVIAHKTGELGTVSHDAAIIYSTNGPYIFVMMSESKSPAGAVQRIADTSKAVYDYFEK